MRAFELLLPDLMNLPELALALVPARPVVEPLAVLVEWGWLQRQMVLILRRSAWR